MTVCACVVGVVSIDSDDSPWSRSTEGLNQPRRRKVPTNEEKLYIIAANLSLSIAGSGGGSVVRVGDDEQRVNHLSRLNLPC